ncbi:MAG: glycosyltransferase [Candidatus Absconditabacteria bacterium]
MSKKVSVCIPTYEMKGNGEKFLKQLFDTLDMQTIKPYEVCISDHSVNDEIKELCEKTSSLNIVYQRYEEHRGSNSWNINNAISMASGNISDIMFQDDFYYDSNSLNERVQNLKGKWGLTSTIHLKHEKNELYWKLTPEWRNDIYLGRNSIGSPSLCTFYKDSFIPFDTNLRMLMDCDFYEAMKRTHGDPDISNVVTVVTRQWDGQLQHHINDDEIQKELAVTISRYENK